MKTKTIIENEQTYEVRIYPDGSKEWYQNGELHRLDGPACEFSDGSKFWYQNGKRHRLDGPAIEWPDGSKYWFQNGKRHRLDGPAIEYPHGSKYWYQNGKRHRLDGPAVEDSDGSKEWWINDIKYSKDKFNQLHGVTDSSRQLKRRKNMTKKTLTPRQQAARLAVRTRQARDQLFAKSPMLYDVALGMAQSVSSEDLADTLKVSIGTVRAVKATITRGVHSPLVELCRFDHFR
jgi:hypothetical protein